jgi:hypothetical protein
MNGTVCGPFAATNSPRSGGPIVMGFVETDGWTFNRLVPSRDAMTQRVEQPRWARA